MRVVGRISLSALAGRASPQLRQAVLAFNAELEAASFDTVVDAMNAFPGAAREGARLTIALDAAHCAVVVLNCPSKTVVIEFVGLTTSRAAVSRAPWSKSA